MLADTRWITFDELPLLGESGIRRSWEVFGTGDDRLQAPPQQLQPDPEKVRCRLRALIEIVRSADKMPWSERDARMWQIVFPNMANWLPDNEAEQLRFWVRGDKGSFKKYHLDIQEDQLHEAA